MFYLTTHSTHFYLRLYDIGYMVKDHSNSERGNPLPPHGLLFVINSKGSFICTIPQTGFAFVTPVMEHWLEREIAQWVHPMKDRSDDPSHHERTLLPWSYISLLVLTRQDKTRQDNFILIRLHRVQYGENINKIDSQSVFCSGS